MRTEALVLLRDESAQKMAATWDGSLAELAGNEQLAAWARAAGLPLKIAQTYGPPLLQACICLPDGTLAALAQQYLQRKVREDLGL